MRKRNDMDEHLHRLGVRAFAARQRVSVCIDGKPSHSHRSRTATRSDPRNKFAAQRRFLAFLKNCSRCTRWVLGRSVDFFFLSGLPGVLVLRHDKGPQRAKRQTELFLGS